MKSSASIAALALVLVGGGCNSVNTATPAAPTTPIDNSAKTTPTSPTNNATTLVNTFAPGHNFSITFDPAEHKVYPLGAAEPLTTTNGTITKAEVLNFVSTNEKIAGLDTKADLVTKFATTAAGTSQTALEQSLYGTVTKKEQITINGSPAFKFTATDPENNTVITYYILPISSQAYFQATIFNQVGLSLYNSIQWK